MALDYRYKQPNADTTVESAPISDVKETSPYKTSRKMDGLTSFISMQQTVNQELAKASKDDNPNAMKESSLGTLQTGGSWNK